ncbi:hypothetical protein Syun_022519 [Stephania yunnanensis]|uniref:Pentatricopeptide repeat-containing protein n=1 Tax=Stephania yunnanensis TaxID=152371 RepID=A0AAP0FJ12_9MAGN
MAGIAVCVPISAKVGSGPTSRRQKCSSSSQSSANLRSLLKFSKLDEAVRMMELPDSGYGSIEADLESYSLVLHACISQRSLEHGQRVHMGLLECRSHGSKLLDDPNLKTKLITLYSVCGQLDEARRVFEEGIEVGLASKSMWLAMLIACSRNDCSKEALLMYAKMQHQFIRPCNFAFSSALKACSNMLELQFGRAVHAQIAKFEEPPDQIVNNALMKFYSDCGSLEDVLGLFERMPQKDVVSWNCLIGGFIRSNYLFKALDTFRRMQFEEVSFTLVTLTMILPVCARLTALSSGKEIHSQLLKSRRRPDIFVLNSLMDMYAKCGAVTHCREVFNGMPNKDLTSWNTMIMGYAVNGFADEALNLFDEMINVGLKPNDVTFISLLSGCSHTGFTSEGQILFERMEKEFGLSPSLEHYACLVDLLGRAGRTNEAFDVMNNMPMSPGGSILGSLLNSCRLHGNITIGELVAKSCLR